MQLLRGHVPRRAEDFGARWIVGTRDRRCDAKIVMRLPPEAFTPAPKVHSAVVHLTRLTGPRYPADEAMLTRVTTLAFGQRRKMLRSSLKALRPDIEAKLVEAGIAPTQRAEEISLEAFCGLCCALM